jgi:hypothetical protein
MTNDDVIPIGTGGQVHVALDVDGYYSPSAPYGFVPISTPVRILDTRDASSTFHGSGAMCMSALSAVPSGSKVLVATATAVNPE